MGGDVPHPLAAEPHLPLLFPEAGEVLLSGTRWHRHTPCRMAKITTEPGERPDLANHSKARAGRQGVAAAAGCSSIQPGEGNPKCPRRRPLAAMPRSPMTR